MKIKYVYIILLILTCSYCATPPRTASNLKSKTLSVQTKNNAIGDTLLKEKKKERFADTTIIPITAKPKIIKNQIVDYFNNAVLEFDNENYESSCPKFQQLSETIALGDSLLFESEFYNCECFIIQDKIEQAELKLTELIDLKSTPSAIIEKSLLRLGHIYCYKNQFDKANEYFDKLRVRFPKSVYLKLADCKKIKK